MWKHTKEFLGEFQSTRPEWGETPISSLLQMILSISIHSPRVGRDGRGVPRLGGKKDFNPLAPPGARLFHAEIAAGDHIISIHSPTWGETFYSLYSTVTPAGIADSSTVRT